MNLKKWLVFWLYYSENENLSYYDKYYGRSRKCRSDRMEVNGRMVIEPYVLTCFLKYSIVWFISEKFSKSTTMPSVMSIITAMPNKDHAVKTNYKLEDSVPVLRVRVRLQVPEQDGESETIGGSETELSFLQDSSLGMLLDLKRGKKRGWGLDGRRHGHGLEVCNSGLKVFMCISPTLYILGELRHSKVRFPVGGGGGGGAILHPPIFLVIFGAHTC